MAAAEGPLVSESSETLRKALLSVVKDPLFQLGSPETNSAKELAQRIADMSHSHRKNFQDFADMLTSSLKRALILPGNIKCFTTRRERVWSAFHQKQITELPLLWSSLFRDLELYYKGHGVVLLTQHVNQKLFECMLTEEARCNSMEHSVSQASKSLSSSEANALRYSAGYVPFALKKKLEHRPEFVKCLEQLEVKGEGDSYLAYTTTWINSINRGKLFQISDEAFYFFCELERKVGPYLRDVFASASGQRECSGLETKKEIVSIIVEDTDIHFSWLLLCLQLDDDELSKELLSLVVEMWITIRGFSMASAWVEYYKQSVQTCTKKKQGLRKGLKRKQMAQSVEDI